jgi:anti-sigma regulatory factor (Ser/Thr protein kinase)
MQASPRPPAWGIGSESDLLPGINPVPSAPEPPLTPGQHMGTRATTVQSSPESKARAAGTRPRLRPVHGSVVLGLLPAEPQPRAAWASLLPVSRASAAKAREDTNLFLANCQDIPDDLGDVAVLLVSELVTNAYKAMGEEPLSGVTCIELSLRLFGGHLLIEVIDSSPKPPVPNLTPNAHEEGGRGLAVVDGLSQQWGYFWRTGRKVVYCILPCTSEKLDKETEDGQPFCPAREHD